MSYEPTLIIKKKNLVKYIPIFEEEQYDNNEDISKVAKYLLEVNTYNTITFDNLELVLCEPEFSSFNSLVRNRLAELEIDFREDY